VEGYLSSRNLSEFRWDRGVLLGFYSDRRSGRWSFPPTTHGRMVSLQYDGDAGLRNYRSASRHRCHNRLLSQRGDGHADDRFNHGRLFPTGDFRTQHHLDWWWKKYPQGTEWWRQVACDWKENLVLSATQAIRYPQQQDISVSWNVKKTTKWKQSIDIIVWNYFLFNF